MELYAKDDDEPATGGQPHVVNEDRYAPIPEALLYDPEISADAVRVYGVLRRHGDDPKNCYPGQGRIARLIGRSPRSINGWLRQLEDAGWIERTIRFSDVGDYDSNAYRVFLVRRAGERGVRADERVPVRASERAGYALDSAIKESQVNESNEERKTARVEAGERVDLEMSEAATTRRLERDEALARFEEFWSVYPARNGKKLGKAKAVAVWAKLSLDEHRAAWRGARHYAASGQLAKDAHRWLRDRCWEEWQTPAAGGGGNGTGGRRGQGTTDDYLAKARAIYERDGA